MIQIPRFVYLSIEFNPFSTDIKQSSSSTKDNEQTNNETTKTPSSQSTETKFDPFGSDKVSPSQTSSQSSTQGLASFETTNTKPAPATQSSDAFNPFGASNEQLQKSSSHSSTQGLAPLNSEKSSEQTTNVFRYNAFMYIKSR